jgi:hypothetical protein
MLYPLTEEGDLDRLATVGRHDEQRGRAADLAGARSAPAGRCLPRAASGGETPRGEPLRAG